MINLFSNKKNDNVNIEVVSSERMKIDSYEPENMENSKNYILKIDGKIASLSVEDMSNYTSPLDYKHIECVLKCGEKEVVDQSNTGTFIGNSGVDRMTSTLFWRFNKTNDENLMYQCLKKIRAFDKSRG